MGINDIVDNLNDGVRQVASTVYPLAGVEVMTETVMGLAHERFVYVSAGLGLAHASLAAAPVY